MKPVRLLILIFVVLLLTTLISCQQKEEIVKIGAVLPLTGIASIHGQNIREGIDLAVEEINSNGGIKGKPVKIIYEDDNTNPAKTVTAIKKLTEVDGHQIIIGGVWDILANAAIPLIDQNKILMLSPSALPDTLTETSPYFFSVHSPVLVNQKVFEEFIKKTSAKRIGAIVVNNPWGLAHLNTLKKAIGNSNMEFMKEIIVPNFDNNDLSTELTLLKDLNLDLIFTILNFNDNTLFGRKMKELEVDSDVLAHSNFASAISSGKLPIGAGEGVTIFRYSDPSKGFIEKFSKEYNKNPEIYSDIAYDTVYLIKSAVEKYGIDPDGVIKGIRETDFNGASGRIYFGDKNYPENKQPVMETIINGKFIPFE